MSMSGGPPHPSSGLSSNSRRVTAICPIIYWNELSTHCGESCPFQKKPTHVNVLHSLALCLHHWKQPNTRFDQLYNRNTVGPLPRPGLVWQHGFSAGHFSGHSAIIGYGKFIGVLHIFV